jgi:GNAT superfamily N-acetyltransferase
MDTSQIIIRKAELKDCEAIFGLIQELAVYEKAPQEVETNPAILAETGFGSNPLWKGLVAEIENQVIGFALYYTRFSTWKGARMYLEDFYVQEAYRKYGIGKRLFDELIQICDKEHFNGMVWQVLDWNTPALNFYAKYNAGMDPEWINGSLTKTQIKHIIHGGL